MINRRGIASHQDAAGADVRRLNDLTATDEALRRFERADALHCAPPITPVIIPSAIIVTADAIASNVFPVNPGWSVTPTLLIPGAVIVVIIPVLPETERDDWQPERGGIPCCGYAPVPLPKFEIAGGDPSTVAPT